MKKLASLFLLLSALIAGAQSFAPSWYTNTTSFATNSIKIVTGTNVISVITADVNGDGKPDLISLSGSTNWNFPGTLTVFTNNGSGVLGSNATYSVASGGSIAAADVNGDGWVDLVCSVTNGTVVVFTNNANGSGGFAPAVTNNVGPLPTSIALADANGDGHPDLFCGNAYNNGALFVLTNNGSGGFVPASTNTEGFVPHSVVATDLNGDRYVDVAFLNSGTGSLNVLTNNGSGKMVQSDILSPGGLPQSVTVADVNGDGRPDFICADYEFNTSLVVFTNNGGGRFVQNTAFGAYSGLSYPIFVTAVTNINGRGELGIVVANSANSSGQQFLGSTLTVLTNNGSGLLGFNATFGVGSVPESIAVADFNSDGRPHLAVADAGTNQVAMMFNATIFYNTAFMVGTYSNLAVSALGSPAPALSVTNKLPGGVLFYSFTNTGVGSLGGTPVIGDGGTYSLLLVASNNVYPYLATQRVSLTINQRAILPGAVFGSNSTYNLPSGENGGFAVADVNGDGYPDVICASYLSGTTLTVLTNNGNGVLGSNSTINLTLPSGYHPYSVVAADVNGDGKVDLISENYDSGSRSITVLTNNGVGVFGSNAMINLSSQQGSFGDLTVADVNGDGKVDLIWPNINNNSLVVFTNNGSGVFGTNAAYSVEGDPIEVVAADINGDGRVALICQENNGTIAVLTNSPTGNGVFASDAPATINTGSGVQGGFVAADIYGNGKLALIYGKVTGTSGSLVVLTNNGNGIFGLNATNSITGSALDGISFVAADVNCDGKVDLIANNYATTNSTMTVLTNNGSGVFGLNAAINLGTNGGGIVSVDLNGDGRPDFISESSVGIIESLTVLTNATPLLSPALTESGTRTFTMPASGYPAPAFSESGALPGGVTFTAAGVFTGTPNAGTPGTYSVVVTATNVYGTNIQNVNLVINSALALVTNVFGTAENTPLVLTTNNMLGNSIDLDSFPIDVSAVSSTSTNGGTVVLNGDLVTYTYTPVSGFTGLDEFTYTATDTGGDSAQGTVQVIVIPPGNPSYNTITTTPPSGNQFGLQYTGVPGQTYYVQTATNLVGPYTDVLPGIVANGNGLASTTITISLTSPSQFYRVSNTP